MDDVEVEFVERFGLMSEEDGMPRISGRIFGLLLLRSGPMPLDDIAESLQVSKTSVSTNTRLLDRMGMVERTGRPGDRRAFYQISPDALEGSFQRLKSRMNHIVDLLDDTIPRLDDDHELALQRLTSMKSWYVFLLGEMDDLLARWRHSQGGQQ